MELSGIYFADAPLQRDDQHDRCKIGRVMSSDFERRMQLGNGKSKKDGRHVHYRFLTPLIGHSHFRSVANENSSQRAVKDAVLTAAEELVRLAFASADLQQSFLPGDVGQRDWQKFRT